MAKVLRFSTTKSFKTGIDLYEIYNNSILFSSFSNKGIYYVQTKITKQYQKFKQNWKEQETKF